MDDIFLQAIVIGFIVGIAGSIVYRRGIKKKKDEE
jgi:hypothetical protein